MPNTPADRHKLKLALHLIANKYGNWIGGNERMLALIGCTDIKFDVLVKFLDEAQFMPNYQLTNGALAVGCYVNGFFSTALVKPFELYINRTRASDSTLVHELLHLLTHETFRRNVSSRLTEGVTEYFTRKVQGAIDPNDQDTLGFRQPRNIYPKELASIGATRGYIKDVINPMLPAIRAQTGGFGRQRNPNFMHDPARGVNTDDMVKRAYFKGEIAMIDLIKENSDLQ